MIKIEYTQEGSDQQVNLEVNLGDSYDNDSIIFKIQEAILKEEYGRA